MNAREIAERLEELAGREWDLDSIQSRCREFSIHGIPRRQLDREEVLKNRMQILDRVQRRGEEYNYFCGNCARGAALAVMEEFGFGSMEILKALSAFPGFGGTGWMCGAVSGGLISLSLFLGSEDLQDFNAMRTTMEAARKFMGRFEREMGGVTCRKIQQDVIFGRFMDPGASPENMKAFQEAKGFEKCSLVPGIGARIAAELILDHIAGTE